MRPSMLQMKKLRHHRLLQAPRSQTRSEHAGTNNKVESHATECGAQIDGMLRMACWHRMKNMRMNILSYHSWVHLHTLVSSAVEGFDRLSTVQYVFACDGGVAIRDFGANSASVIRYVTSPTLTHTQRYFRNLIMCLSEARRTRV